MLHSATHLIAAVSALTSSLAAAQVVPPFSPAAPCPTCQSPNYYGKSNVTLAKYNSPIVQGKAFNRFIQVWLENTDYATALASPTFQNLAKQGVLMTSYLALTHPSEPNYIASIGGDFFGLGDDQAWHIPSNISTIVDLLENKNVSWATYQENMPTTAYPVDFKQPNYLNASAGNATYYVRKHNGLIIYDSITNNSNRAYRIRNFNDFGADVNASAIPQWSFIVPNMVNNAHDTSVNFTSAWIEAWLNPLLTNQNFNAGNGTSGTLILLTFDENENYTVPNRIFSLLLGSAVPPSLYGTTDNTLYTHYSSLATVEANWNLGNLGRGDVNTTLANVYGFVAKAVNFTNSNTTLAQAPQTNLTHVFPGPLNPALWTGFVAPVNSSRFGKTFFGPGLNLSITTHNVGSPINISYAQSPFAGIPNITYPTPLIGSVGNSSTNGTKPNGSGSASLSFSMNGVLLGLGMTLVGCALHF